MFILTHIVSGLLLALAASGFAQGKPDFSGEWTLNRQTSTLSPAAASIRSGDVRIEHRDPTFRYRAVLKSETDSVQYEFEFQKDSRRARRQAHDCCLVLVMHSLVPRPLTWVSLSQPRS
jgi:hypothetical protein